MRWRSLALVAVTVLGGLGGCASEQWYGAGQLWQRQECNKMPDAQQRNRCMTGTSTSYDQYQRQRQATEGAK